MFPKDIGGMSTAEVYDPITDRWTYIAPMSFRRSTTKVGVINGEIYAVGGNYGYPTTIQK